MQEAIDRSDEETEHNIRVINNFQASLDTSSGSSVDIRVIPANKRVASEEESTDSWRIDRRARFCGDSAALLNINIPSSMQETEASSASALGSPSIASQDQRVVIEIRVEAPDSIAPEGLTARVVQSDCHRVRTCSEEESCDQTTEQDATEEEVARVCATRELAWKFEIEILNAPQPREEEEGGTKRQTLNRWTQSLQPMRAPLDPDWISRFSRDRPTSSTTGQSSLPTGKGLQQQQKHPHGSSK